MTISFGQKVKCDVVVGATGYDFDLRNGDGGVSLAVRSVSEPEITAEALFATFGAGNYTVRCRATSPAHTGNYTPAPYLALEFSPLGVPGNLRVE